VSHDLQKMVWEDPEPKGSSKLVLLCMASFVSHDAWKQGRDLLAWPSQNTIARRCGIQRSTVERALKELLKLQKIADTGMRKQRRTVVYELYPSTAPDLPDPGASDLPDSEASDDMPGDEASDGGLDVHLPDSAHDLPDFDVHLPDSAATTCPNLQHKRVRKGLEESELGETKRAQARASIEVEDLSEELAGVEKLLEARPNDKLLGGRRAELRQRLGTEEGSACL
jgi:Helix-turn-helix domain